MKSVAVYNAAHAWPEAAAFLRLGRKKNRAHDEDKQETFHFDGAGGAGDASELNVSTATFQVPPGCFFQIVRYLP